MSTQSTFSSDKENFHEVVWQYYADYGRHDLPWRLPDDNGSYSPYEILVSELMLQQTQVARVITKFATFTKQFPTVESLATAELGNVLKAWQGLGYNRRAKYLWQSAQMIMYENGGRFPSSLDDLQKLPGVGRNTAGAIMAYAFNSSVTYVETNIRTVYIHHFFANSEQSVSDKEILTIVASTLPQNNSIREWYWALMDYGSYLKKTVGNLNKMSKTYNKQSAFKGSRRELRGSILRMLTDRNLTYDAIASNIHDDRVEDVLKDLTSEGLVKVLDDRYFL